MGTNSPRSCRIIVGRTDGAHSGVVSLTSATTSSRPGTAFNYSLTSHLSPSYRVEAVDTTGHWPAVYLARAGIPLTRGWYRQNDFPVNQLLYRQGHLGRMAYVGWLRSLGVRYVVA